MDQPTCAMRLTGIQGLLQGIQYEVCVHATTDSPADDPACKDVDHERHVQPALPGRYIGEVRHPQLVRAVGMELALDAIQRAKSLVASHRCAHDLATPYAL
ncbi:hypothetical protein D9M68_725090 [compost metagenome]